jgi:hypothetical protein
MKRELEKELCEAGIMAKVTLGEIRIVVQYAPWCSPRYEFPVPDDLNLSASLRYAYDSPTILKVDYSTTPKSQEKFDEWKANYQGNTKSISIATGKITIRNILLAMHKAGYTILTTTDDPTHPVYLLGKENKAYRFYQRDQTVDGYYHDNEFRKENNLAWNEIRQYALRLEVIVDYHPNGNFKSVVRAEKNLDGKFIIPNSTCNKDSRVFIILDPETFL